MKTTLDKSGISTFHGNWMRDACALHWQLLVISVFLLTQMGVATAAKPIGPIVTVSTVKELQDAVGSGARKIRIEPGIYAITDRIALSDVEIEGLGGNVNDPNETRPIVNLHMDPFLLLDDPGIVPFGGSIFVVSGKTSFTNIKFSGIDFPGLDANTGPTLYIYKGSYIQSASNAHGKHEVTIKNCRFISAFYSAYASVSIGNSYFTSPPRQPPQWKVKIEDNYFEGGAFSVNLTNTSSQDFLRANNSSEAIIKLQVSRNDFFLPFAGLYIVGGTSRDNGNITVKSSDNRFESWIVGLVIRGATEEVFSYNDNPGGSFNRVTVDSKRDRFANSVLAVEILGTKRHSGLYGPGVGNQVKVRMISPVFELDENFPREVAPGIFQGYARDIDIIAGYSEGTLPANGIDETTEGPGNSVEFTLLNSDFRPGTGRVWTKNHANFFERNFSGIIPGMDPEPSFGNSAKFNQTRSSFDATNGPVNEGFMMIPDDYFKGRWD